ncbi:MAG: hypothetical protein BroJett018_14400 [Chloroflexota bacterium]|nr:MAG: hypothetical protein BroJett018_14400 [Chloroflexota bacterium]
MRTFSVVISTILLASALSITETRIANAQDTTRPVQCGEIIEAELSH